MPAHGTLSRARCGLSSSYNQVPEKSIHFYWNRPSFQFQTYHVIKNNLFCVTARDHPLAVPTQDPPSVIPQSCPDQTGDFLIQYLRMQWMGEALAGHHQSHLWGWTGEIFTQSHHWLQGGIWKGLEGLHRGRKNKRNDSCMQVCQWHGVLFILTWISSLLPN